VISRSLDYI